MMWLFYFPGPPNKRPSMGVIRQVGPRQPQQIVSRFTILNPYHYGYLPLLMCWSMAHFLKFGMRSCI